MTSNACRISETLASNMREMISQQLSETTGGGFMLILPHFPGTYRCFSLFLSSRSGLSRAPLSWLARLTALGYGLDVGRGSSGLQLRFCALAFDVHQTNLPGKVHLAVRLLRRFLKRIHQLASCLVSLGIFGHEGGTKETRRDSLQKASNNCNCLLQVTGSLLAEWRRQLCVCSCLQRDS